MPFVLAGVCVLGAPGCCASRKTASSLRDSVRVEVHSRTEWVRDTVWREIPMQSERVAVRDTVSVLENDYARSEARILCDGTLLHALATRPRREAVPYMRPVERRDSVVWRDRTATTVVEVPRALTAWQRWQMRGFWVLLAAAAAVLLRKPLRAWLR